MKNNLVIGEVEKPVNKLLDRYCDLFEYEKKEVVKKFEMENRLKRKRNLIRRSESGLSSGWEEDINVSKEEDCDKKTMNLRELEHCLTSYRGRARSLSQRKKRYRIKFDAVPVTKTMIEDSINRRNLALCI